MQYINQLFEAVRIEGFTLAALIVGASGNFLYTLTVFVIKPFVNSIKRRISGEKFDNFYGSWILYRESLTSSSGDFIKISISIKRRYYQEVPEVTWENPGIKDGKSKGRLYMKDHRWYISLSSRKSHPFAIVLIDHGIKTDSSIKIGAQTGFLRSNGNVYSAKVVLSRLELKEENLSQFFHSTAGICFDSDDALNADQFLAPAMGRAQRSRIRRSPPIGNWPDITSN